MQHKKSKTAINGIYRIEKLIADGPLSSVYLARDLRFAKRHLAIKIFNNEYISPRVEDVIRFRLEAGNVIKVNYPTVVKVYEVGEFDHTNYVAMEFVPGKDLFSLFQSGRRFTLDEALMIIRSLAKTLDFIHKRGVIHKDLNPGNIILTMDSGLQGHLTDFGVYYLKNNVGLMSKNAIKKTYCYLSPEASGALKREIDERSDLYSLGILAYHLITNFVPFEGSTISALAHKHVAQKPFPLQKHKPQVHDILNKIIL